MTDDTITVVAGLGRCGSSMVMQMLVAGGMEATGAAGPPFWEDGRATWLPINNEWLDECKGKVVKLLGVNRMYPPAGHSYRWVWMDRDRAEQVKSQHKIAKWLGRQRAPIDLGRTRRDSLAKIETIGGPVLELQYESIVSDDVCLSETMANAAAIQLAQFCELPPDSVEAMAAVVRKRSGKCSKEVEEERQPGVLEKKAKLLDLDSCGAQDATGAPPRCGLKKFHEGQHTWAAPPREMSVNVAPVRVAQLSAECPSCAAPIVMLIQDRIAMLLVNGGDLPGMCAKCGQRTVARVSVLVQANPQIVVAKR